jgi:hypothetical protein
MQPKRRGACSVNPVDNTEDCNYTATFNPAVAGPRSAPLTVSTTLNDPAYLGFVGTGLGAGATLDPAAQFTFGQTSWSTHWQRIMRATSTLQIEQASPSSSLHPAPAASVQDLRRHSLTSGPSQTRLRWHIQLLKCDIRISKCHGLLIHRDSRIPLRCKKQRTLARCVAWRR